MERFGTPQDLISTILWLISEKSSFVNGIVVPIDGGFSAYSGGSKQYFTPNNNSSTTKIRS